MNFTKNIIATAVLLATSSIAVAATTDLTIEIDKAVVFELTGDLATSQTKTLSEADVSGSNNPYTLGQLGLSANTGGNCDISMTSDNAYRLIHESIVPSLFYHGILPNYTVAYAGKTFGPLVPLEKAVVACNNHPNEAVKLTFPTPSGVIAAGKYSDTLRITIATSL